MSTPARIIIEIGIIILPVLTAMILYIRSEDKKRKLYLSIFMAVLLLFGATLDYKNDNYDGIARLFRVLILIVPLYLYLSKAGISILFKKAVYAIIGLSLLIVLWESFACSNFGAMPLCGLFTILLIMPLLIFLYFIILLFYVVKIIKRNSALIVQTYRNNKTKILLILSMVIIVISYALYQQSLPKWTGVLHYDRNLGFVIPSWTDDLIISENPKAGITHDVLHSYESKKVIIYGTAVSDERNIISASCAANKRNCGFTIIPDKIKPTK